MEDVMRLVLAQKAKEESIKEFYGRINITLLRYYLKDYSDNIIDKYTPEFEKSITE